MTLRTHWEQEFLDFEGSDDVTVGPAYWIGGRVTVLPNDRVARNRAVFETDISSADAANRPFAHRRLTSIPGRPPRDGQVHNL
jgi:hypothetical protein